MIFRDPEYVAELTHLNPFQRSSDGRPQVPDELLERMRLVTNDEAWSVLERRHGYHAQFVGGWPVHLHPDRVLVGRAVTAQFVPLRPDLNDVVNRCGATEGRIGQRHNTWVIDTLGPGDVLLADLFGKVRDGTLVGDNLSTAIRSRTGTGPVVEGRIRDLARIQELSDFPVYARGVDPSAIADVTLAGVNVPNRMGRATVLPGDVVLGTTEGITFVPPHLAREVVEYSEDVRERDVWGKQMLDEGRYTSAQIDALAWAPEIEAAYQSWRARRPR